MRTTLAVAAVLTLLASPRRSSACQPPYCFGAGIVTPTVPASAKAVAFRSLCRADKLTVERSDGSAVAADVIADPFVSAPSYWVVPREPWAPGEYSVRQIPLSDGGTGMGAFTVVAAYPLPKTATGSFALSQPTLVDLSRATEWQFCTTPSGEAHLTGQAMRIEVTFDVPAELRAAAPVLYFRTLVDGVAHDPLAAEAQASAQSYGQDGRTVKRTIFAACEPRSTEVSSRSRWFVSADIHRVQLEAIVLGEKGYTLRWPEQTVDLRCDGLDGTSSDGGACSFGHATSMTAAAAFLGVIASLRRRARK